MKTFQGENLSRSYPLRLVAAFRRSVPAGVGGMLFATMLVAGSVRVWAVETVMVSSQTFPSGSPQVVASSGSIVTNGNVTIPAGADVTFHAETGPIVMNPGFSVASGATFHVEISTKILVVISGDNQSAPGGSFNAYPFDVGVWDVSGAQLVVGAAIQFTVVSGGGGLALTDQGSPVLSSSLTLNADSEGSAKVYFKHAATSNISSQILVTSDALAVYLATTSQDGSDPGGNGIPDSWEVLYFNQIGIDPNGDWDADGLTNILEYQLGCNPVVQDTDGDGLLDGLDLRPTISDVVAGDWLSATASGSGGDFRIIDQSNITHGVTASTLTISN